MAYVNHVCRLNLRAVAISGRYLLYVSHVFRRKLSPGDASPERLLRQNNLIAPQALLPTSLFLLLLQSPMAYVNHVCHRAH
jgi:hypothetical protein